MTLRGAAFLAVLGLVFYASLSEENNLLILLLSLGVTGLVTAGVMNWRSLRGARLVRIAPASVWAGEPFWIRYELTNGSVVRPLAAVWVGEEVSARAGLRTPGAYLSAVSPGGRVTVDAPAVALRRGVLRLGTATVRSGYPFGLFYREVRFDAPAEVVVMPPIGAVYADPFGSLGPAMQERQAWRRVPGLPDEFYGLREYRAGDSLRDIYWRRSARTGTLVVREHMPRTGPELVIVVDHRLPGAGPEADHQRELAVSAAATLACHASSSGTAVGLVGLGSEVAVVPPGSGQTHLVRVLTALARLEGEPDRPPQQLLEGLALRAWREARCVWIGAVDDSAAEAAGRHLTKAFSRVVVLVVDRPEFRAVFAPDGARAVSAGQGRAA